MTDKRVVFVSREYQDKLIHTLPVWARERILEERKEGREDAALLCEALVNELAEAGDSIGGPEQVAILCARKIRSLNDAT